MIASPGCAHRVIEPLESRQLLNGDARLLSSVAVQSGPPPQVQDVHIRGTIWSPQFISHLQAGGLGTAPLGRWINPRYSTIHPWLNVNQITIRMTDDMVVESDDFRVRGVESSTYLVASVETNFDRHTFTTTATFTLEGDGSQRPTICSSSSMPIPAACGDVKAVLHSTATATVSPAGTSCSGCPSCPPASRAVETSITTTYARYGGSWAGLQPIPAPPPRTTRRSRILMRTAASTSPTSCMSAVGSSRTSR